MKPEQPKHAMSRSMTMTRHLRILVLFVASLLILAGCGSDSGSDPAQAATDTGPAGTVTEETGITQEPSDPLELASEVITETDFRRHIELLASDEFGGRAPASAGEELTVNYLVENFKSMGLEPAHGDSYTQAVPLAWVELTNNPDLVLTAPDGKKMELKYPEEQVIWTRQQVAGTSIGDSELVFVGYGIVAPEYDWDDYAGIDVERKTVVILVNDPGYATQDPALFNGNAMTYYGRWDYKFDEANRHGAAGAIIIHDRLPAAYPWSTVENSWTGRQFDLERADQGASLMKLEGWIRRDNAKTVFEAAGLDLDELYEKALQPDFAAVPMDLKASATLVNQTEAVPSKNVAAILRGSEAPEEIFIYMAHWDHLGTDPKLEGDQIYNGALDNASGTAALLEIAKAYAALPVAPRRSVLFLALTAEEQGLLGSLYYATHPLFPLASTAGGLNMDGMNNFGATRDITVIGLGMSDLDDYLTAAAAVQERIVNGDREAEKGYYYRSDHFELAKEGVPMLFPWNGYDDRKRGLSYGMEKADEYTNEHYHRVSDEYDLSWDVSGAMEDMQMYFKIGLDVANSDEWPNWKEGAEFKAKRDAQRAGQ